MQILRNIAAVSITGILLTALACLIFNKPVSKITVVSLGPGRVKPQIAVEGKRVFMIAPDGSLWRWGYVSPWATGHTCPCRLGTNSDWAKIALGSQRTLAIKTNGTLWTLMPLGTTNLTARQIGEESNWMAIAAGLCHFVALKADGSLWTWGTNNVNQIGTGSMEEQDIPIRVGEDGDWVSVAASQDFTVAVQRNGSLWAWGSSCLPTWPPTPMSQIGTETNWVEVYAVTYEFVARKRDGSCWMGGSSTPWLMALLNLQRPLQWGELAHAEELDAWRPIAFGSCAFGLASDGSLHGVGINWGGILGGPPSKVRKGPVQVGSGHDWQILGGNGWTLAGMTTDGGVWAWGERLDGIRRVPPVMHTAAKWLNTWGINFTWSVRTNFSSKPEQILQFRF